MIDLHTQHEALAAPGTAANEVYDAICDRGNLTRRQLLTWAGDRVAPGLPVFVEGGLFRIRGPLDVQRFERSFQSVVEECDALRTVFDEVEGWPRQRLLPPVASPLRMVDLSAERFPQLALEDLARTCMDSALGASGHLFDAVLARMGSDHHAWVLAQHQLVSDACSFWLVHARMAEHYRRPLEAAAPLAPAPLFGEYLRYERAYRASSEHRVAREYWRSRLAHLPVRPVSARARLARDATRIRRVSLALGRTTTAALRRLAATQGVSPDVGLFVVFASLAAAHLYRTTGTRDVLLSVPFANRPSHRFKATVGSFMNVCPIRVAVEQRDSFRTLLDRVEHETWQAARHQGCVVPQVAGVQPYDVLVNYHKEAVAARTFADLPMEVGVVEPTHRFGTFALGIQDFNGAGDLVLVLDFNEATFGPEAREALTGHLLRLLDGCLADPMRAVDDVNLVGGGNDSATPARDGSEGVDGEVSASDRPAGVAGILTALWCELLRKISIDADDDFFELGGDSLLAYHMLMRVGVELSVDVAAERFFERPTIASLAAAIEVALGARPPDEIEDLAREIEGLADDEAAVLLETSPTSEVDR